MIQAYISLSFPMFSPVIDFLPVPVAVQSKASVCSRSLAEIACSNPTGGMDVCLLWMLCVVRYRSLFRADHSSRGVIPTVLRHLCDLDISWMRRPWPTGGGGRGLLRQNQNKIDFLLISSSFLSFSPFSFYFCFQLHVDTANILPILNTSLSCFSLFCVRPIRFFP